MDSQPIKISLNVIDNRYLVAFTEGKEFLIFNFLGGTQRLTL